MNILEVDINKFNKNIDKIENYTKKIVIPILKANAYGTYINKRLDVLNRFDIVGVSRVSEAIEIRNVGYNKEKGVYVSNVFEIYDKETCEYIVEDWLRIKDYEELLNTPKENVLNDLVADLKHIECNTYKEDRYKEQVNKIIKFLKEEW